MQSNDFNHKDINYNLSQINLLKDPIKNSRSTLDRTSIASISSETSLTLFNLKHLDAQKNIKEEEIERAIKNFLSFKKPQTPKVQQIFSEATEYLQLLNREEQISSDRLQSRLNQIREELLIKSSYWQTTAELTYGAKVAWRNNARCIGRLFWKELIVKDLRHLQTAEEVFAACVEHLDLGTNNGKIQPIISIFKPGIRILNPFLIRYAGYKQENDRIIGDPASVNFTKLVQNLGWQGKGSAYDLLPLVIHIPGQLPQLFDLPPEVVMEVSISHPEYDWFEELNLKWYALPVVADKELSLGGISYTCCPFNGWYMGSEIGSRNFADSDRYNMLPIIAEKMGLNTNSQMSLWKDRALVELNIAILHSFTKQGITIVDHHTASRQFMQHIKKEAKLGRKVPADWGWIVPPISGSATEVFHQEFNNEFLLPNFVDRSQPNWKNAKNGCPFHS